MDNIILIGSGGHAKACIDVIETSKNFNIKGLIDLKDSTKRILGYSIIGNDKDLINIVNQCNKALICIGQIKSPNRRLKVYNHLIDLGFNLPVVV